MGKRQRIQQQATRQQQQPTQSVQHEPAATTEQQRITADISQLSPDMRRQAVIQLQREHGNDYVRRKIRRIHGEEGVAELDAITAEANPQQREQTQQVATQQAATQGKPVVQRSIFKTIGKWLGFAKSAEVGTTKVANSAAQTKERFKNKKSGLAAAPDYADTAADIANFAAAPAGVVTSVADQQAGKSNPVGRAASWLGKKASSFGSWVWGGVKKGAAAVASGASAVGGAIKQGAGAVASGVGSALKTGWDTVQSGYGAVKQGLSTAAKAAREGMGSLISRAGQGMATLKEGIMARASQLKDLQKQGAVSAKNTWNFVKTSAINFGRRVLSGAPVRLQNAMQQAGQLASGALRRVMDTVKGDASAILQGLGTVGKMAKDGILGAARTVGGTVKNAYEGAKSVFSSFKDSAKGFLGRASGWLGRGASWLGSMFGKARSLAGKVGGLLRRGAGAVGSLLSKVGPLLKAAGPAAMKFLKAVPAIGNVVAAGVAAFHGGWALAAYLNGDSKEAFSAFKKMTNAAVGIIPVVGTVVAASDLYLLYRGGVNMTDSSGKPVKAGNTTDIVAVWLGHAGKAVKRGIQSGNEFFKKHPINLPVMLKRNDAVSQIQRDANEPKGDPQALDLLLNANEVDGMKVERDDTKLEELTEPEKDEENKEDEDAKKEAQEGGGVLEELPQAASDEDDAAFEDDSTDTEPADPDAETMLQEASEVAV